MNGSSRGLIQEDEMRRLEDIRRYTRCGDTLLLILCYVDTMQAIEVNKKVVGQTT